MKRNLLSLLAIVVAIGFSAFTSPSLFTPRGTVYLTFNGGDQKVITNFSQSTSTHPSCNDVDVLCYAIVNDASSSISQTEWYDTNNPNAGYFEALDVQTDGSDILDDETSASIVKKALP